VQNTTGGRIYVAGLSIPRGFQLSLSYQGGSGRSPGGRWYGLETATPIRLWVNYYSYSHDITFSQLNRLNRWAMAHDNDYDILGHNCTWFAANCWMRASLGTPTYAWGGRAYPETLAYWIIQQRGARVNSRIGDRDPNYTGYMVYHRNSPMRFRRATP